MITIADHALVRRDITVLRDKNTPTAQFRAAMHRLGSFVMYEATRSLAERQFEVSTPIQATMGYAPALEPVFLPVLRAGLALVEPALALFPAAYIGHIGLRRNEKTLQPEEYYYKMPPVAKHTPIYLLDPMLATGGSICAAIERLHLDEYQHIAIVSIIAAPEGIQKVRTLHSGIHIYTAVLDDKLNDHGYIVPGLGDAGDRYFAT